MKIAIIGTGGVGGYFGAKLAQAGNEVTFLARGEHLKEIQQNGLTVNSILGDFRVENIKATDKISNIEKPDLVIISVKAWQVKGIGEELKPILKSDTTIIPLQNGVLAADELMENIERKHILGGLCRIISKIEAPGLINHFGVTPTIVFGEIDKSKTERLARIQNVFSVAGIESRISDDIEADIWKKFISICVSGLLAVSNTTYGDYLLSKKIGINIEEGFVDKTVSFIDSYPADSTSSLTRDVWEKKPSEIEYQNGTVVRLGEKYGVATPVNRFVYSCILPSELKARGLKQ
jgi:2-dehydropantoate 2-reductase